MKDEKDFRSVLHTDSGYRGQNSCPMTCTGGWINLSKEEK